MKMKIGVVFVALLLCSCAAGSVSKQFSEAQQLVEQTMRNHPKLVRLTIHAVPTGETQNKIIACNVSEKIGRISDSEDLRAIATGQAVVLREGNNLDVTMPIADKTGKIIAAAGITLAEDSEPSEKALMMEAEGIAHELTVGIQEARRTPW